MQGHQREAVSQHVPPGLQTNTTVLSKDQNNCCVEKCGSLPALLLFSQHLKSTCNPLPCMRRRRGWPNPGPPPDFLVGELYSCFDMPLSNTPAPWPAARHRQQGYNPSVEPSLSHRVLIRWGGCGAMSLQPWLFSPITLSSEKYVDPKLEGFKVWRKEEG